jgi:hypothetical protein
MNPAPAQAAPRRCRRLFLLALAALAAGAGGLAAADWQRVRHLALPTLADPSLASAATVLPVEPDSAAALEEVTRLPGRVSALLLSGGTLWAAGFDTGVFRLEQRGAGLAAVAVLGVAGRERFVNALAERDGRLFAATYGGILELDAGGRIARRHLPRIASEALLATDEGLLAGTAEGLFLLRGERFEKVQLPEPLGSPRVTALAVAGGRLWLGTVSGVRSIEWSAAGGASDPRWHPLVFGEQAARSNVVLALVPWGEGVLAGTDDAGVVEVGLERVRAFESVEPRANEINPGAAAMTGGRALFGTQGGGLVAVGKRGDGLGFSRPRATETKRISALLATPEGTWLGGDDGAIHRLAPEEIAQRPAGSPSAAAGGGISRVFHSAR